MCKCSGWLVSANMSHPSRYTSQMTHSFAQGGIIPPANRCSVPSSAAPEKCKLEMPVEEFRSWHTSMQWWLKLNGWGPADAVGFIRLSCLPVLQRALDAKYTVQQWSELSTEAALEAIKQIVVLPTNQAAEKEQFYNLKQGPYESISAYFTRATTVAANYDFNCPECAAGLGITYF